MRFVYTKQDEKAVLALLWVLTIFLVVCTFGKIWTALATVRAAKMVAEAAMRESMTLQGTTQEESASDSDAVEQLRQKNIFAPRPPKQNPITEVTGILGSEALINGRWCKVGDMIGEARVMAVEATRIEVLWAGQTLAFSPAASGKPSTADNLQVTRQYAASAGQKPAQEENLRTYQPAAPYGGATSRSELGRFVVDPPQSWTVFSPGLEEPFRGPSADTLVRIRQMAETRRLAEAGRMQQQKAESPADRP